MRTLDGNRAADVSSREPRDRDRERRRARRRSGRAFGRDQMRPTDDRFSSVGSETCFSERARDLGGADFKIGRRSRERLRAPRDDSQTSIRGAQPSDRGFEPTRFRDRGVEAKRFDDDGATGGRTRPRPLRRAEFSRRLRRARHAGLDDRRRGDSDSRCQRSADDDRARASEVKTRTGAAHRRRRT